MSTLSAEQTLTQNNGTATTLESGIIDEAKLKAYQDDGFVLGGQVITDEEVEELRSELQRVIDEQEDASKPQPYSLVNFTGNPDQPVWQIVNIWQASDAFRRLINNSIIVEAAAKLLGSPEMRIWHDQIQYKPAERGGVNGWHQDAPLWPVCTQGDQVTAWVALDDVDLDNGCMQMVPGSHKWGDCMQDLNFVQQFDILPETYKGDKVSTRTCPVKKGHVHFHHSHTWHGSNVNESGRPRRAIALHFMGESTKFVGAGMHLIKPLIEVADGEKIEGSSFHRVF